MPGSWHAVLGGSGLRSLPTLSCPTGYHHLCLHSESNMPLTMPALFVLLEMKDYVPDTWAGRRPTECWEPRAVHFPSPFLKSASKVGQGRVS